MGWLWLVLCLQGVSAAPATLPGNPAAAQRWSQLAHTLFQHLGPDQGLPHPIVSALAEDASGFIWIGTQGGLARWDGYRLRTYLANPKDPASLPDSFIQTLLTDRHGQLWIGTNGGGLARYDAAGDKFIRVAADALGVSHGLVLSLVDDGADGLFVGTQSGLDHYVPGKGRLRHWQQTPPGMPAAGTPQTVLPSDVVRSLLRDRDGNLWIGTRKGLMRMRPDGGLKAILLPMPTPAMVQTSAASPVAGKEGSATTAATKTPTPAEPAQPTILSLRQGSDGRIWIGTAGQGVFIIKGADAAPQALQAQDGSDLSHEVVACLQEVAPGQMWLGTFGQGVLVADGARIRRIRHDPSQASSLANNTLMTMLVDRSGALWLGGQRGISRHDPGQNAILTLFGASEQPNRLSDSDVTGVLPLADGRIWLGMQTRGAQIINSGADAIQSLPADASQPESRLPPVEVRQMAEGSGGAVYLATSHGLYQSDTAGSRMQRLSLPDRDPQRAVASLLADGPRLWLGGVDGLWLIDPLRKQMARPAGSAALEHEIIEVMLAGKDDTLWIGTRIHGLYRYHRNRHQLQHFAPNVLDPQALQSGFVASLLLDARGRLWVGTQGGGISLLLDPDVSQPRMQQISSEQGLPNNLVDQLLEDLQGRIWASTDGGLAMIDANTLAIRSLQRADGVIIPGYWANAGARSANGELLFGGTGGITVVRPAQLRDWTYRPPVVITNIHLGGKMIASSRYNLLPLPAQPLEIRAEANSIAVEFSALDFSAPEHNRYAYKLDGYDRDWIETDPTRRLAAYTNLPPGDYRLRLRGSNRNGVWSETERVLPLRVQAAWHQSWWFRLCALLLLALLMSALVRALVQRRTRNLRLRQHELEALVQQRTGELRQLGDIGREITANLDADIVFQSLTTHVSSLLDASSLTIYRITADGHALELVVGHDNGTLLPSYTIALDATDSFAAQVAREKRELLLEFKPEHEVPNHVPGTHTMLSALFAPLIVDAQLLGVMSIQSEHQYAYGERERLIFRSLSAYGAIALANAQAMSRLHQAQVQLVQQEKLASLGGMVAGIAHEINTPLGTALMALSGIASAWRTLQDALAGGRINRSLLEDSTSEGLEYTQLALGSAARAAELITTFMSVAVRVDDDRVIEIDLAQYLPEIAGMVRTALENRGGQLQIEVKSGLTLRVVPEALTEALTRIVANAMDHAFDQCGAPLLRLTAQPGSNDEVVLEVHDNGCGISSADLARVFDPFFTTKSGLHGHVGLGLHVAYNYITQRLKGSIRIQSSPGQGTTVTIRLKNA